MNWLKRIKNKLFPQKWYVVFFTRKKGYNNYYDSWVITESRKEAQSVYETNLGEDNLYCGGIAEIKQGTEHWGVP